MSFPLTPPPDTEERPIGTPIYLIPLSPSALFSSRLQENKKRLVSTALRHNPDLEDISSIRRPGVSIALRLAPRLETSRYNLGSGNKSDIIIRTQTENECYVHLQHCQLIPDPDKAAVTMLNSSRTTFTVQDIDKHDTPIKISPSRDASISQGEWYITLGQGLEFFVIVLPRDPDADEGQFFCNGPLKTPARTHLSDKPALSSTRKQEPEVKKGRNAHLRNRQKHKAHKRVPSTRTISLFTPTLGSSNGISRKEIIASNDRTRVFKYQGRETFIAVKKFRNEDLDLAAKSWETEKAILEHLKPSQDVSFSQRPI